MNMIARIALLVATLLLSSTPSEAHDLTLAEAMQALASTSKSLSDGQAAQARDELIALSKHLAKATFPAAAALQDRVNAVVLTLAAGGVAQAQADIQQIVASAGAPPPVPAPGHASALDAGLTALGGHWNGFGHWVWDTFWGNHTPPHHPPPHHPHHPPHHGSHH